MWSINGDRRGVAILCVRGIAWVTEEGDLQDYTLGPGEEIVINRPGLVVVQGLPDAEILISAGEKP